MIENGPERDLASLRVARVGRLLTAGEPFEPYRLVGADGMTVWPVAEYLKDLQACGRSSATQRSYGMDLLRWFRFLWAIACPWDEATRVEARDYSRFIQLSAKPLRYVRGSRDGAAAAGGGSRSDGRYAAATAAHSETVLRRFYAFHLEAGSGPMVNPFPPARGRRAQAHRNPMEQFRGERAGLFRPKVPVRVPRQISDEVFNELFAKLRSDRDRALVAFWISTGVRASELLGVLCGGVDPGQQLITVIRKGSRALQAVPASPDAFVWHRLYWQQMHNLVPAGADDPVWWTLRRPFRQLGYHAARAMFDRANAALGAHHTLHELRHSAAYRMARDPQMPITDVQWVLGHAHLTTTQIYVSPTPKDVVDNVLAHHRRQAGRRDRASEPPAGGYRPETLDILFGKEQP